ncbi:MAG: DUF2314 domain-containing protein [Myxococcota bacterium]
MNEKTSIAATLFGIAAFLLVGMGSFLVICWGIYHLVADAAEEITDEKVVVEGQHAVQVALESGDIRRGDPVPAGELISEKVEMWFAIYHLDKQKKSPAKVATALVRKHFPSLQITDALADNASLPAVLILEQDARDVPPPAPDRMKVVSHGLSEEQERKLQSADRVTSLHLVAAGGDSGLSAMRDLHRAALSLARKTNGIIYDEWLGELFTPEVWQEQRLAGWDGGLPYVPAHMVIHHYNDGPFNRSVTLGMAKFGLPDIVFEGFPRSSSRQVGNMVNLVAQTLAEKGGLEKPGRLTLEIGALANAALREELTEQTFANRKERAVVELTVGEFQEGDPHNRLIAIAFPGDRAGLQQRQDALFVALFGSSDEVSEVEHDDEILAASDRARKKLLGRLKKKFIAGLPPGERLLVKAPFKTPEDGNEWMWMEIVSWKGTQVNGILINDPYYIPGLESGAQVAAAEEVLFEYIHYLPDGSQEGNETGDIMSRRMEIQRTAAAGSR